MSHWSTVLIIDNIRDVIEQIRLLQSEVESLASSGDEGLAEEAYSKLYQARVRLQELEEFVGF